VHSVRPSPTGKPVSSGASTKFRHRTDRDLQELLAEVGDLLAFDTWDYLTGGGHYQGSSGGERFLTAPGARRPTVVRSTQ